MSLSNYLLLLCHSFHTTNRLSLKVRGLIFGDFERKKSNNKLFILILEYFLALSPSHEQTIKLLWPAHPNLNTLPTFVFVSLLKGFNVIPHNTKHTVRQTGHYVI